MSATFIERLQQMPLFGGLTESALRVLLSHAQEVTRPASGLFFSEGERGDALYVLNSGEVELTKDAEDDPMVLTRLKPGDCFGEMAIIDFSPRSATARAVVESQALEVSMDGLLALYQSDVEQFAMIHMNMARELSRRLRQLGDRLRG